MTKTRATRTGPSWGVLALATAIIASTSVPHIAAAQSADRVWAQCTLTPTAVTELITSMTNSDTANRLGAKRVAFVVIYSLEGNDGQPLSGVTDPEGSHTGPVICRNTTVATGGLTSTPTSVLQTDNIPSSGGGTVDVLDVENALVLRYRESGTLRKRYCHTVDANEDCFLLR